MTQLEHTQQHPGFVALAWGVVLAAALATGFAVGSAASGLNPFDTTPAAGDSTGSGGGQPTPDRDGRWGPQLR